MALKKVETCIIDATKLLEAADKLADLHGEVSEDIIERTKEEALNIVSSSPISSPGVLESIKTKNPLAAHDLITKAALEELVKCSCGIDINKKLSSQNLSLSGLRKVEAKLGLLKGKAGISFDPEVWRSRAVNKKRIDEFLQSGDTSFLKKSDFDLEDNNDWDD